MTNPTSNFNWQMPTPTDLVTDLPADFEVFGQAVDTSMADLLGGTTGQILAKNSNSNMDFIWVTNDVGDITAVTVSSPLTGGGTSGSVSVGILSGTTSNLGAVQLSDSTSSTSTTLAATANAVKTAYDLANAAIAKSTVTTAGDIIYRNATVPARLGIGTANQVLAVNSGATAPEWVTPTSGGMTLLSTTTLSGTSNSISVTGTGYKDLVLYIYGLNSASNIDVTVRLNSITANTYLELQSHGTSGGVATTYANNFTAINLNAAGYQAIKSNSTDNAWNMTIWDCNSTSRKIVNINGSYLNGSSANIVATGTDSVRDATSAITNVTVISSATLTAGTCQIYGVK
jgi:hypothetical protein